MSGAALCAVCLNYCPLDADSFLIFPCGHGFCTGCITGLCSNPRPKCPNCRRILRRKDAHPVYIEFIDSQTFHETSLVEGLNKIPARNDVKKSIHTPAIRKSEGSTTARDNLPSTSARSDGPGSVPKPSCTGMASRPTTTNARPCVPAMGGTTVHMFVPYPDQDVNLRLSQIPITNLCSLKQELGFGDKSLGDLNWSEKTRIVNSWHAKMLGSAQCSRIPSSQAPQIPTGAPINRMKRNSTGYEIHDAQPYAESSPPERKRVRRSPMEQPAIPVTPYPLHIPGQHPPGPPGSLPSGLPQLPPLQQNTMQPSYPPQLVQQGSGSARVPPPLHQARLLLMQQQHQMTAGAGPLVQPKNPNVQGGVSTQMHLRQSQPPQQPALFRPSAPPIASLPQPAVPMGPRFNTPLTRLALAAEQNTVGIMQTSPGIHGFPKDVTNKTSQSNGQSHWWLGEHHAPEAWIVPASPTPVRSNQTSPSSQQPMPSNPGESGSQPTAGSSMLGTPVCTPFPPNLMEQLDLFKDINFERDFEQWFNSVDDESGSDV